MRHYHIHTKKLHVHVHDDFEESDHPRGQPENSGDDAKLEAAHRGKTLLPEIISPQQQEALDRKLFERAAEGPHETLGTEAEGLSNETDDLQPASRTNDKEGYKNPGYLFRKG